jgi:hypothetical protein
VVPSVLGQFFEHHMAVLLPKQQRERRVKLKRDAPSLVSDEIEL